MDILTTLGSAAGLGFLAGIRLYFTVFALGLSIRLGWFEPSGSMQHLTVLSQTPILVASGLLVICEFVADKIPWFDSMWDAVHTFIRPVGAAALGLAAFGKVEPSTTLLIALVSGATGFAGHASKAATRVTVNHSPEPFSNWFLSFGEDVMVPAGLWLVVHHPIVSAIVIAGILFVLVLLARVVIRLLRSVFKPRDQAGLHAAR